MASRYQYIPITKNNTGKRYFTTNIYPEIPADINDIYIIKVQQVCKVGDPDILMCYRGRFIAWELKVGKNKATPLQQYKLDEITNAGGIARLVTPENVDECLGELLCLKESTTRSKVSGTLE